MTQARPRTYRVCTARIDAPTSRSLTDCSPSLPVPVLRSRNWPSPGFWLKGAVEGDLVGVVGVGRPERVADTLTAAHLKLSETDLADIELAVPRSAVAGERYAPSLMAMLDSEQ